MALTQVPSGMIANTGVTAGVYGNSGNIVSITVNSEGQITAASNVAVSIPSGAYADSNNVILMNNTVITSNTTVGANKGLFSVGPVSVASGITVAIGSGSRWVVL